ncbi:extracellular solute-binding protein [Paenibacillus sp. 5J-6]|uniref:Extracellular solute-binding protein n=1 Tax=Paenibacillus silvestris TaxID=2606219 RepID=A0A6L8USM8_9BACL|nr:extracellular solute-binding protein [Paenibacillus silvestris]MZQ81108.1 extracellular solute-binding protein [Paenibacillus silvestris]
MTMITSGMLALSLVACSSVKTIETKESPSPSPAAVQNTVEPKKAPVKIKYATYRVGTHVSAAAEKKILDEFKKKYNGEIDLQIEEIPGDQAYVDKIKVLAASKDLPDVVEGKNGLNDLLIKGNLATPLNEYLEGDAAWKAEVGNEAIKSNSRDGKVWSIANGAQLIGYFYNRELFDKAGVKPAATWDEFLANLEKIKTSTGIAPLAMMTGENAWTTNLLLGAIVGTSGDAGNKFMNTPFPKNFETPEFIEGLKKIQTILQKYTTKDALGAGYANAANNFLQGKAAIIANGPWMISDFSDKTKALEGFDKKVGVAMYPNSGMFSSYEVGYMLTAKDKETKDAAIKLLKFLTDAHAQQINLELSSTMPLTVNVKPSDEFKQKNPLFMANVELGGQAKNKFANLDSLNFANVTEAWKTLYPELNFNKATAEEIAKKLSTTGEKNK